MNKRFLNQKSGIIYLLRGKEPVEKERGMGMIDGKLEERDIRCGIGTWLFKN